MAKGSSRTRMQRVPNVVLVRPQVHSKYRDESEDDHPAEVRMVKVIDLVLAATGWAAATGIIGLFGENVDWWRVLTPLGFLVIFLLLVPIHKVEN